MGTINVNGGGPQVVQYRTGSGHTSRRLAYNDAEDLEVNDGGDQLWIDFCFISCGAPSQGPANVMPGDEAFTFPGLWKGIGLEVYRNGKSIYKEPSS